MKYLNKFILVIQVFLLSAFMSSSAFAINPSRTCVCLILQCEMKKLTPIFSNPKYSMNSIKSFRENRLKIQEIDPGIDRGYIFQEASKTRKSRGFDIEKAAARLRGIEYFNETSGEDTQKKTIQSVVIVGQDEITKFLNEFDSLINAHGSEERRRVLTAMVTSIVSGTTSGTIFGTTLDSQLQPNFSILNSSTSHLITTSTFGGALLSYFSFKYYQELIAFSLIANKIQEAMKSQEKSWSLLSTDTFLTMDYKNFLDGFSLDNFIAIESLKNMINSFVNKSKKSDAIWLATDFFFEKGENQEPELHIILRTSEGRPILPKTQKDSEKNSHGKSSESGSGI